MLSIDPDKCVKFDCNMHERDSIVFKHDLRLVPGAWVMQE
jgi:hypothetical protein